VSPSQSLFTKTGGARIGFVNYTWPLATLTVSADTLTLRTTMFGLFGETYTFSKDQVTSIDRYRMLPLIGDGIRITHTVADYPRKIIFWCRPSTVLNGIASAGFSSSASPSQVTPRQVRRGLPFRWPPVIALVAVWNLLIACEIFSVSTRPPSPGLFLLLAVLIVFVASVASLRFPSVQRFWMKPDRHFGEIKPFVSLLALVTGFISLGFAISLVASALKPSSSTNAFIEPTGAKVLFLQSSSPAPN
jgi:hypothetical protein